MLYKNSGFVFLVKLWILHYLVYYWIFGLMFFSMRYSHDGWEINHDFFKKIALSPLFGLLGLYDGMVILIPVLIYLIFRIKFKYFKSYYLTLILYYTGYYIYFLSSPHRGAYIFPPSNNHNFQWEVNVLSLIIPSLSLTIMINYYFLFRNASIDRT